MAKKLTINERRIAAQLCACWKATVEVRHYMGFLAESSEEPKIKSRLAVLGACAQAHSSRLLGQLSSFEVFVLPVPSPPETSTPADVLSMLRRLIIKYAVSAELARTMGQGNVAWVMELNRAETEDALREIREHFCKTDSRVA